MKTPFISAKELQNITNEFPTPFHLYDEKGIREKARALNKAFAWNKGFKEYFAVKATPTPAILIQNFESPMPRNERFKRLGRNIGNFQYGSSSRAVRNEAHPSL